MTQDETVVADRTPPETSQSEPALDPEALAEDTQAAPETTEPPKPELRYASWKDALADADPDDLLKDPRIEGRIGQVADKRARDLARKQQEAAEAERLRNLRKTDPLGYVNEVDRQESEADQAAERARAQQELADSMMSPLNEHLQKTLPKEALEKLAGKQYTGATHGDALMTYVDDIVNARLDHEVSKARAQWEKDERPALRKQVLAELNGGDDQSIAPVATGRHAGQQFNSNYEASSALMNGDIGIDAYRQLVAAHPDWR